jgi:hypothetical protein
MLQQRYLPFSGGHACHPCQQRALSCAVWPDKMQDFSRIDGAGYRLQTSLSATSVSCISNDIISPAPA